jgi:diguanylate cyclase
MGLKRELPFDGERRKRGIYTVLLALAAVAAALAFVLNAYDPRGDATVAAGAAGILLVFAVLTALTAWRRIPLDRLERLLIGAAATLVFLTLAHGLYVAPSDGPHGAAVAATMLWVPLLFVFCSIAFDGMTSLRYSLAIYLVVLALTLPHAILTRGGPGVLDGLSFPLQAYLAYAVTIVALYFFSDIRQRVSTMEEAARSMRRLANTDALTGLANRRQAEEQLLRELRRAERYGRRFSVLMMDLDRFKELNDRFGHLAGDDVLVDLARRIQRMVRGSDTIARWGGEEFLLLAPETALADARRLAEMIRLHVDTHTLADRYRATISLGVASYRPGDSVQSVIARADAALYEAKRSGRNQVKVEIAAAPAT